MVTVQMLPIIIIILVIHIYIVIWCTIKAIKSTNPNDTSKVLWICSFILLPIFGVIIYLIANRQKALESNIKDLGNGFDENIQNSIFFGLFYTYVFLMAAIVYFNPQNLWIISLLSASTILTIVIHFRANKMDCILKNILPYILVIMVTSAEFISSTQEYKIIILVVVALIIIEYPLNYSKIFFWIPLVLFQLGSLVKMFSLNTQVPPNYLISFVFRNTVTYMLVVAAFYFAKRQLIMNNYLQYLMKELKNKSQELEEASILRERSRIAREIHDTLGHTLTGAIIQLEVAKQLVYQSPEKAEQSIQKTQDITRQGFNDVKRAIKALRPIMIEDNTLIDGLNMLFDRVKRDYNLFVDAEIDLPYNITGEMKVDIYRILQELVTNSMRHGEASEIKVSIEHQFDTLRINCQDNGKGSSSIKEGNGLTGIRERVDKLKGHVDFRSQVNQGFGATIYIPL